MCFGRSDLRGAAPTGLDKPARLASITSRDEKSTAPDPRSKARKEGEGGEAEGYGESYELSLAAKRRKREEKLKKGEGTEYDPVHGRQVKGTGLVQGNLGGPLGGGAGMALG